MSIYLDNNATTPCNPQVVEQMLPYLSEKFGNPASKTHFFGWTADEAVQLAIKSLKLLLNAQATDEIVFTSGATEACNLAIKGTFELFKGYGNHIITSKTEHKAVLDTCKHLEKLGAAVTYLDVQADGLIINADLESAITNDTILIALMYANNETGVVQNIEAVSQIAKKHKVLFFCDATQAIGKIPVDVQRDGIDMLAISAHKFYGPKGIGALYLRRKAPRVQLVAQIDGGGHQNGFRSGTLNVPGVVGLGAAVQLMNIAQNELWLQELRDMLEAGLLSIKDTYINGNTTQRLPNTSNIAFEGIKAERLISILNKEIAFSVGSACTSAEQKASHVLQAMGLSDERIDGSVRFSVGLHNTKEEIASVVEKVTQAVLAIKDKS